MNILRNIKCVVAAVALIVTACENTLDVTLPYERRLVVDQFIGRAVDSAMIVTQTLPPLANGTIDDAILHDVSIRMRVRDSTVTLQRLVNPGTSGLAYAYRLPGSSFYHPGDTVYMTCTEGALTAEAQTVIPDTPEILGFEVRDTTDRWGNIQRYVFIKVRVHQPCVLWPDIVQNSNWNYEESPMSRYQRETIVDEIGVSEHELRYSWFDTRQDSVEFTVFSADRQYGRYLESNRGGGGDDDLFGSSGANPYFNVRGGGIGAFYGVSTTSKKVVPR